MNAKETGNERVFLPEDPWGNFASLSDRRERASDAFDFCRSTNYKKLLAAKVAKKEYAKDAKENGNEGVFLPEDPWGSFASLSDRRERASDAFDFCRSTNYKKLLAAKVAKKEYTKDAKENGNERVFLPEYPWGSFASLSDRRERAVQGFDSTRECSVAGAVVYTRISITLQVIVRCLSPASSWIFPEEGVSFAPGDLERATGPDGRLLLRIPGCAAPAAPFVLFRLKRSGYSDCRAVATKESLLVEGRR